MKLSGSVPVLETAGFGAWRVDAAPADLAMLGKAASRRSGRSIIGLKACELNGGESSLTFQLDDVSLLNLGDTKDCIAVLLEVPGKEKLFRQTVPAEAVSRRMVQEVRYRRGDHAFIEACHSENLPEAIIKLVQDFLTAVREFSSDELQEGLHRKWVTYPKNFLAITIQNRNKQFCIHVKKTAVLPTLADRLDIRDDRPGYARFWLQNESQLSPAIRAARASFDL